ncbi:hypothetical protein IGI04_038793, partial [Brassica rapa subsp. trilocularis]
TTLSARSADTDLPNNRERPQRESRSRIGSSGRPARERACRHRSPSSHRYSPRSSLCSRLLSPPPCLSSGTRPPVADLSLARGEVLCSAFWFCLREAEAPLALSTPVPVPARWRLHQLCRRRSRSRGVKAFHALPRRLFSFRFEFGLDWWRRRQRTIEARPWLTVMVSREAFLSLKTFAVVMVWVCEFRWIRVNPRLITRCCFEARASSEP